MDRRLIACFFFVGIFSLAFCGGAGAWLVNRRAPTPPPSSPSAAPSTTDVDDVAALHAKLRASPKTRTLSLAGPPNASRADLETCARILDRRFARANIVGEASVTPEGKIAVGLVDDPDTLSRAGALMTAGGHLQFKAVLDELRLSKEEIERETARVRAAKKAGTYDAAKDPADIVPWDDDGTEVLVENGDAIEGHMVANASVRPTGQGAWYVDFTMNPEGKDALIAFTKRLLNKHYVILLDGRIRQLIIITGASEGDSATIGWEDAKRGFTEARARALAAVVSSGRLPLELSLEEEPIVPEKK